MARQTNGERLIRLETLFEDMHEDVREIRNTVDKICRDLKGNGKDPGFFEEVRKNRKFRRNFKKLYWILVSVIVAQLGVFLFWLITRSMS